MERTHCYKWKKPDFQMQYLNPIQEGKDEKDGPGNTGEIYETGTDNAQTLESRRKR